MKNSRNVCFLFLAVIIFAGSVGIAQAGQKALEVRLNVVAGQMQLTRDGKALANAPTAETSLYEGDVLETLAESKAELVYLDGTTMRMKPQTKVELGVTSLRVWKGQAWYKFTKRGSEFIIETPSLVAGIRGTEFDISVNARGKSILSVISGAVGVRGKISTSNEVVVKKGMATTCFVGGVPTTPIAINLERKKFEWPENAWMMDSDPFTKFITLDSQLASLEEGYRACEKRFGKSDPRTIEARERVDSTRKAIEETKKKDQK